LLVQADGIEALRDPQHPGLQEPNRSVLGYGLSPRQRQGAGRLRGKNMASLTFDKEIIGGTI
jgi:hypothetical protein